MDSLPDDVVQYILSNLSYVKDLASCNCVSKKWKDLMSCHKSLCFPRVIFDNLTGPQTPDSIMMKTVSSVSLLDELVVSCPFTSAGLASWLLIVGSSVKDLELNLAYDPNKSKDSLPKLECIQAARNLESLRLSNMVMAPTPKWDVFQKLRNLEIRGAKLEDSVLTEALRVTPNLTELVICYCKGLSTIRIELLELQRCRVYVHPRDSCSLTLRAPKIKYLVVQDCNWIRVHETDCLNFLSIGDVGVDPCGYRMFRDSTTDVHLIRTNGRSFILAGKEVSIYAA